MTAIALTHVNDIDLEDVIRRSPEADVPHAEAMLRHFIQRSIEVRYGFIDGKLGCIWGLRPPTLLSNHAMLWLVTTDVITEHKFLFVRHSQRYVEEALKKFPLIKGHVHVNNHRAQRWIKWLGAEFDIANGDYIPFVIRA